MSDHTKLQAVLCSRRLMFLLPDMISKMLLPRECLGAEGALMRCFTGVQMHVVCQMLLARKRLRAVRTFEWRLAGVLSVNRLIIIK